MISEDIYRRLLAYSIKIFKDWPSVNPIDVVHDIVLKGGVTETNFTLLFSREKYKVIRDYNNRPESFELREWGKEHFSDSTEGFRYNKSVRFNNCQYCYECNDYFPLDAFYSQGEKLCKYHLNKKRYEDEKIRDVGRDRTEWHKEQKQKSRNEIRDAYVIDVLKKNGFNREDMTKEVIAEKKKLLYLKRQNKLQKPSV